MNLIECKKWLACAMAVVVVAAVTIDAKAASDEIGMIEIPMSAQSPEIVLNKMVGDVRAIFKNYKPAGVTVKKEVEVTGSSTHPFMTVTMEKCVFLACQTVEMKADLTVVQETGKCAKNYLLKADISKSSETLSDQYGALNFKICFNKSSDGKYALVIKGLAEHGPGHGGAFQPVVYEVLQAQLDPIGTAIKKSLKAITDRM